MTHGSGWILSLAAWLVVAGMVAAQEAETQTDAAKSEVPESAAATSGAEESHGTESPGEGVKRAAGDLVEETKEAVGEIGKRVDQSEQARQATTSLLDPIYRLAEQLSFPAFHWVAFALMATGVVSFALQLILGKLVVLSKFGFSFTEIMSDVLGLAISVIGLVLTTQAATENSNFTHSPASVLSSAAAGLLFGFIFYVWGQRGELQAVEGRRILQNRHEEKKKSE